MQQPPYPEPGNFAPPPPQQYPMPPRQPGRISRFVSWYRIQNILVKIIVALAILFVIGFVGSAAIAGVVQGVQEPIAATPTVASQPTSAPTQAPTPTATKQLTQVQHVAQLITSNVSNDNKVEVTDNDGKTVNAIITLNSAFGDNNTYQTWIKQNCFAILKAEWTANIPGLKDVNLAFRGVDFPGPIGRCEVTAATSKKDPWSAFDPDTAWTAAYDVASFYPAISG